MLKTVSLAAALALGGGSIITYRPSQPSINNRLARLCRELPVAVLPH
jgi:hypothetical protein